MGWPFASYRLPVCEDRRVVALKAAVDDFHGGSVVDLRKKNRCEWVQTRHVRTENLGESSSQGNTATTRLDD